MKGSLSLNRSDVKNVATLACAFLGLAVVAPKDQSKKEITIHDTTGRVEPITLTHREVAELGDEAVKFAKLFGFDLQFDRSENDFTVNVAA